MNNLRKVTIAVTAGTILGLSNIAIADGHKQGSYDNDKAAAHSKNSSSYAHKNSRKNDKLDALTPSVRLILNIQGVDHDIKMSSVMGVTTLFVSNAGPDDIASIRQTYEAISNTKNFEIQLLPANDSGPYETLDDAEAN